MKVDARFRQLRSVCCRSILSAALLAMAFSLAAPPAGAQSTGGRIRGTVVDPSGGAVPAATVQLVNEATHATREAQTGANGEYVFIEVPVGTYAQIRLIPVDASAKLLSSASALGAVFNSEVDYTDSTGTLHQVPLELQNPDKGFGIATSVEVKGDTSAFSSTDKTTAPTPAATSDLAINVDGAKDIVPFTWSNLNGMLLNPHMTAYDQTEAGAIQGMLYPAHVENVSDLAPVGHILANRSTRSHLHRCASAIGASIRCA